MNAQLLINAARRWLDVPYQHQGRTRHGVDCLGLLVVLARELGVSDYDEAAYSRNPSGRHMRLMLDAHLIPKDRRRAFAVGDVLHMAAGIQPQHLAIVSGVNPLRVIHAHSEAGRVVEQRLDSLRLTKIRGVYRIPGMGVD